MSEKSDQAESTPGHMHSVGGALCLDFINTISGSREEDSAQEHLQTYMDLVGWSEGLGALSGARAAQLRTRAERQPESARVVLQRAIGLREALYRIFVSHITGMAPDQGDLDSLNQELGKAMAHLLLQVEGPAYTWIWDQESRSLDQILWPIARSAAEILTSGDLDRVCQCAGDVCEWLFVDRSKNRSRRWCDMKDCGNVAKARRYRRRQSPDSR